MNRFISEIVHSKYVAIIIIIIITTKLIFITMFSLTLISSIGLLIKRLNGNAYYIQTLSNPFHVALILDTTTEAYILH